MASVTFRDGTTVSDDANEDTGLRNGGHRARFVPALVGAVATALEAKNWASLLGSVVFDNEYSAKEYAVGNLTATGGSAKQWATKTSSLVSTDYSAKEWAIGTTVPSGSAKRWAIQINSQTDNFGNYSAREWAIGTFTPDNSAKQWAIGQTLQGGFKSARTYAEEALASAQSAVNTPATSATSTTSNTIPTVFPTTLTYIIQPNKGFVVGQFVIAVVPTNVANYVLGQITEYNATTGSISIVVTAATSVGGSGTFNTWNIALTAVANVAGAALLSANNILTGLNRFTGASNSFDGSVGIGTITPASRVHANTNTAASVHYRATNSNNSSGFVSGVAPNGTGILFHIDNLPLSIGTNNIERIHVTATGLVGVGAVPTSAFDVSASNAKATLRGVTGSENAIEVSSGATSAVGIRSGATNIVYSTGDMVIRTGVTTLVPNAVPTGGSNVMTITAGGQVNVTVDATTNDALPRLSQVKAIVNSAIPPGMYADFAGDTAPNNSWIVADGRAVSRTAFPLLFAYIGTKYGVGDGSTTFNVPNVMDRYRKNRSSSIGALQSQNLPNHFHGTGQFTGGGNDDAFYILREWGGSGAGVFPARRVTGDSGNVATTNVGGNSGVDIGTSNPVYRDGDQEVRPNSINVLTCISTGQL